MLVAFAAILAMLSYINVSVNVPDRQLTIKLGKGGAKEKAA
jgi:hypothetical protein